MNTLQCPRCALRFRHASELRDHLGRDHARFRAEATTAEDDLLEACHCHHRGHAPRPTRSGHLDNAA